MLEIAIAACVGAMSVVVPLIYWVSKELSNIKSDILAAKAEHATFFEHYKALSDMITQHTARLKDHDSSILGIVEALKPLQGYYETVVKVANNVIEMRSDIRYLTETMHKLSEHLGRDHDLLHQHEVEIQILKHK